MECDSVHSKIEVARKNRKVYAPNEYILLMQAARSKPRPFEVKRLSFNDFYNISALTSEMIANTVETEEGETLHWFNVNWFRFNKNSRIIKYKYEVKSENFCEIDVTKRTVRPRGCPGKRLPTLTYQRIPSAVTRNAYQHPLPI